MCNANPWIWVLFFLSTRAGKMLEMYCSHNLHFSYNIHITAQVLADTSCSCIESKQLCKLLPLLAKHQRQRYLPTQIEHNYWRRRTVSHSARDIKPTVRSDLIIFLQRLLKIPHHYGWERQYLKNQNEMKVEESHTESKLPTPNICIILVTLTAIIPQRSAKTTAEHLWKPVTSSIPKLLNFLYILFFIFHPSWLLYSW